MEEKYIPNEVPLYDRIKNIVLSVAMAIFGTMGLIDNDLAVSVCRRCEEVYHFSGIAAVIMYIALMTMCVSFVSEVVDHYDKRNNEHVYHKISNWTLLPSVGLFVLAFYVQFSNT